MTMAGVEAVNLKQQSTKRKNQFSSKTEIKDAYYSLNKVK